MTKKYETLENQFGKKVLEDVIHISGQYYNKNFQLLPMPTISIYRVYKKN